MPAAHNNHYFRVAARPAAFVESGDLILEDLAEQHFLLDAERGELQKLSRTDLAMLMTFFESTQCCIWHSSAHFRRGGPRHVEVHAPTLVTERG
jgi:hypothetical protein